MNRTPNKRASDSVHSSEAKQVSKEWSSRIADLFRDQQFRLDWDNDFGYHVARHLQELRRFRGVTQVDLARLAGTAQPKIARVESGDSNVTIRTISRLIDALRGRLRFSIEPSELDLPQLPVWWDCLEFVPVDRQAGWERFAVHFSQTAGAPPVFLAGWEASTGPVEHLDSPVAVTVEMRDAGVFDTEAVRLSPNTERLLTAPISAGANDK